MAHENPLDRIFDSGSYRLVLTGDATSAVSSTLTWGAVFYTDGNGKVTELTAEELQANPSLQVLYKATAPTQADIDLVRQAGTLAGFTVIASCTTTAITAGSCVAATAPYKGYYIIALNYRHSGTTGIIYSNFVVIQ